MMIVFDRNMYVAFENSNKNAVLYSIICNYVNEINHCLNSIL
jgi:hypothetical protein